MNTSPCELNNCLSMYILTRTTSATSSVPQRMSLLGRPIFWVNEDTHGDTAVVRQASAHSPGKLNLGNQPAVSGGQCVIEDRSAAIPIRGYALYSCRFNRA